MTSAASLPTLVSFLMKGYPLTLIAPGIWRIEPTGKMRVGIHLVGSRELIEPAKEDLSIEQAMQVATLPGVLDPVFTMPDMHQGYGFPIGGVAAFDLEKGVVSPGGVGYDINCGVRLLKSSLHRKDIQDRTLMRELVNDLFDNVPTGVGSHRKDFHLNFKALQEVLTQGAQWALKEGFATAKDISLIEENGCLPGADPNYVSKTAMERGLDQVGTLGSGNHFVEIQYVDHLYDPEVARIFGLSMDQVVITIHTGSRGLGYQVCEDYIQTSLEACSRYGIELAHRELAAAPLNSPEGKAYLAAMASAANFAFVNRQLITYWVRHVFNEKFGSLDLELLYDVCHNVAKFEDLPVEGKLTPVCIHRKGATRAYPPYHPKIPLPFRSVGQPILIPGDMGRYSFVLVGNKDSLNKSFGSACHGAGREYSRHKAKQLAKGRAIVRELEDQGVYVRASGFDTIAEEIPEAYKDASKVVEAVEAASIANRVARLRPLGVIKG